MLAELARLPTVLLLMSFCTSFANALGATKKRVYAGIDLGTTFSCVSMYDPVTKSYEYLSYDKPELLTIPSTIYFTGQLDENRNPLYKVGYEANLLNQSKPNSKAYYYGFKRMVGIDRLDSNTPLFDFPRKVTYPIHHASNEGKGYYYCPIEIGGEIVAKLTPTDLSSIVLGEIRRRIDALNYEIISTCISTPVYFTTVQDNEVKLAAENSGFENPLITKEPIAACVSYVDGHVINLDTEENVMVFDLGGGTLDISIVEVIKEKSEDNPGTFESNITASRFVGDNFLGGENINDIIVAYFIGLLPTDKKNLSATDMLRLRLFVEKFKIDLCNKQNQSETPVEHTDYFIFGDESEVKFNLDIGTFNRILSPVYKRINTLLSDQVEGLFKEDTIARINGDRSAALLADSIKKIILVGGSTRVPYIKQLLSGFCPKAQLYDQIDADKAVGKGACQICVNSDPNSGESSIMVLGAVPLPIGIRVFDGSFQEIIKKDVTIPIEASMPFTTVYDNQTNILIDIAMGVRPMFDDNEKIGQLKLQLKNPQPKGKPQIDVKIEYNADYSFKVTAIDVQTGLSESIAFDSKLGKPSHSKIEGMLEAARQNKLADEEIKNKLEQLRLFDAALSMFESQVKQANLNELDQSYFETIIEGNKKWLVDNRDTAKASVIESKLEDLKKDAEELALKLRTSTPMGEPQTEQISKEVEKPSGREVL